jgi:hypothetical protein
MKRSLVPLTRIKPWKKEKDPEEGFTFFTAYVGPLELTVGEEKGKWYGYILVNDQMHWVGKMFTAESQAKRATLLASITALKELKRLASRMVN